MMPRLLFALLLLLPFASSAQSVDVQVLLSRADVGSGCSAQVDAGLPLIANVQARLTANVDTVSLQVSGVQLERCQSGSFAAPSTVHPGGYAVGMDLGIGGADVVELAVQRELALPGAGSAPLNIHVGTQGGAAADQLSGVLLGSLAAPTMIPTLSTLAGGALVLLFAAIAFVVIRRHPGVAVVALLVISFAVSAMNFMLDGLIGDWAGINPTADPTGDSIGARSDVDIVAAFAAEEGGTLYFRVDLADIDNQAPQAVDDAFATDEDTPANLVVLANDSDGDSDPLSVISFSAPGLAGGLTQNGDGSFSYNPAGSFDALAAGGSASESFDYTISDGRGGQDSATVTITIHGLNDAPSFQSTPLLTATRNQPYQYSVVTQDPDTGDTRVITATTLPAWLSFTDNGDGTATLSGTPGAPEVGNHPVTLEVVDLGLANATQSFSIVVTDGNLPTANAGTDTTLEDQPVVVDLSGTSSVGDPLTFAISTTPTQGSLGAIVPTGNSSATVTYTPNGDFNGNDGFAVTVTDTVGTSAPATVQLVIDPVNDAPSFTAGANQNLSGAATAQTVAGWATAISAGPADEAGQALFFSVVGNSNPALFDFAPAVNASNGDLTYTPATGASGIATINLQLNDDGGTANGGVNASEPIAFTISIDTQNNAPSFVAGADQSVLEDAGAQTVAAWATAISDNNGGTQVLSFNVSNNNNGLFAVQPDVDESTGNLSYTPAANAFGVATVSVTLMDDGGTAGGGSDTSPTTMFIITVTAVNDAPGFVAGADQAVNEDAGAQNVTGWATAINDGDGTTQMLSFVVNNNSNALFATQPDVDATTGNLTYTPAANAFGSALVSVTLMDNGGTANGGVDSSGTAQFTITVNSVADAPVATADASYQTIGNVELVAGGAIATSLAKVSATTGLLANDSDPIEMGSLSVVGINGTALLSGSTTQSGTVTVSANGAFVYQPPLGGRNIAADTFTYTIENSAGAQATATVSIQIVDELAWFVHNDPANEPLNAVGGDGRSSDPFDTLAEAETASSADETIFVFAGDGGDTGQNAGIALKDGQRLIGEGIDFSIDVALNGNAAPAVLFDSTANNYASLSNGAGHAVTVDAAAADLLDIEIRGLSLTTSGGSSDGVNATSAGANAFDVTLSDSQITAASGSGIDAQHGGGGLSSIAVFDVGPINASADAITASTSGTGNLLVAMSDNSGINSSAGSGIRIDGSGGAGQPMVLALHNNTISGDVVGHGLVALRSVFDANTSTPGFDAVNLGTFTVGSAGNPVGGVAVQLGEAGNAIEGNVIADNLLAHGASGLLAVGSAVGVPASSVGLSLNLTNATISAANGVGLSLDSLASSASISSLAVAGGGADGLYFHDLEGSVSISGGNLADTAGAGVVVDQDTVSGTFNLTYSGSISNASDNLLLVDGHPSGTLTFNTGSFSGSAGSGLVFDNADGSYVFNAAVSLNGTTQGVDISNGSAGSFNFSSLDIDNVTGAGINVNGGDGNLLFGSVDVNTSGAAGVSIANRLGGALTFSSIAIQGTTGAAFSVNNHVGNIAATVNGSGISKSSSGYVFDVNGMSSGTVQLLSGTLTASGSASGVRVQNVSGGAIEVTDLDAGTSGARVSSQGITLSGNTAGTLSITDADIFISGADAISATGGMTFNLDSGNTSSVTLDAVSGHALNINGPTLVANVQSLSVNNAGGGTTGVSLVNTAGSKTIDQLTITTASGTAITANSAGTLNVAGATNTIASTGGAAVDINATTIDFTLQTVTVTNSTAQGIDLSNLGAGSVFNVTGATQINGSTNEGIRIDTAGAGSNIDFGSVTINNRGNTGVLLAAIQGDVDFGATTIPNQGGVGGYGIRAHNNPATISFASTTISNATTTIAETDPGADLFPDNEGDGDGIYLSGNSGLFTIGGGSISNVGGDGIDARSLSAGLQVTGLTISAPGGHGFRGTELTGSHSFINCAITQVNTANKHGALMLNSNQTLIGITFDNCDFHTSTTLASFVFMGTRGSGNMTLNVQNGSEFFGLAGEALQTTAGESTGATGDVFTNVSNSIFRDAAGATGANSLFVGSAENGAINTIDINNNTFSNIKISTTPLGNESVVRLQTNGGELRGSFANNVIHNTNGRRNGLGIVSEPIIGKTARIDLTIDNNDIDDIDAFQFEGMFVSLRDRTSDSDLIITNNRVGFKAGSEGDVDRGLFLQTRDSSGAAFSLNALIQNNSFSMDSAATDDVIGIDIEDNTTGNLTVIGNTFNHSNASAQSFDAEAEDAGSTICLDMNASGALASQNSANREIEVERDNGGTYFIEGLGANSAAAAVAAFLNANNNFTGTITALDDGGLFLDSAGCPTP
ncbi:tandem-95 repeat protein [Pseudomarimonas arenosa]|uniref:Tandem-95 repeat protein n=1 Tax=Pseudomarimonas arenosa TaxID=2774145 RepID=A0AAW3ZUV1_9GAMM|nr:tandem-95 repeat protein [Pseudomarimonas arenosa]MBD8527871.1 tandem-95 repeat protein [Pseudomarimonas arenosa]